MYGSSGWLVKPGFIDFSGSTVVHSVGPGAHYQALLCWAYVPDVLIVPPVLRRVFRVITFRWWLWVVLFYDWVGSDLMVAVR